MNSIKLTLNRVLRGVQTTEAIICSIGLVITTLLIFSQVINRYFLHFPIMIFGDLALYLFIFFMLVAGAFATWREGHISVDAFRDAITRGKPRVAAIYRVSLAALSIIILSTFMPTAFRFMVRATRYPEWGTLVRWFNTSWLQITLFISVALVMIHLLVIAGRDVKELIRVCRSEARR